MDCPRNIFGAMSCGSSMASTTAITFSVDSYKMFASETLVSFNFLKNLLGFCFHCLIINMLLNKVINRPMLPMEVFNYLLVCLLYRCTFMVKSEKLDR